MVAARRQSYSSNNVVDISTWSNGQSDASFEDAAIDHEKSRTAAAWESAHWTKVGARADTVTAIATCLILLVTSTGIGFAVHYQREDLAVSRQHLALEQSGIASQTVPGVATTDDRLIGVTWETLRLELEQATGIAEEAKRFRRHADEFSISGTLSDDDNAHLLQVRSASNERFEQLNVHLPRMSEHIRSLQTLYVTDPDLFNRATAEYARSNSWTDAQTLDKIVDFSRGVGTVSFEAWLFQYLEI